MIEAKTYGPLCMPRKRPTRKHPSQLRELIPEKELGRAITASMDVGMTPLSAGEVRELQAFLR